MTSFRGILMLILMMAFAMPAHAQQVIKEQQVIMGWVENVYVENIDTKMKAKLDTGATTSSMRAEVLKILKPKGKSKRRSIVFQIEDNEGKISTFERKLVRMVRIKDKYGKFQRRPVVEMEFCVAGKRVHSEVNLAARQDFVYPVLVGRNMLRQAGIIVDPARTFTSTAPCPAPVEEANKND